MNQTLGRGLPLYAKCPRCLGSRYVTAIVSQTSYGLTQTEDFACPPCLGTGEADMDKIIEFALADNERFDEEHYTPPARRTVTKCVASTKDHRP